MPDPRERLTENLEEAIGDADLEDGRLDRREWRHARSPGFAAGRAGDFIIAGASQADVTEIIDVVDGTAGSLADSAEAQQVAAELPGETLSFTYLNGAAILDAVGEETLQSCRR